MTSGVRGTRRGAGTGEEEPLGEIAQSSGDATSAVAVSAERDLSWDEFEARLTASLERMAVDQFFILSTRPAGDDESLYYAQFAQGGRAGFIAEAVSNGYLMGDKQLSPAQEEALGQLGWQFPDPRAKKPENFNRQWPMPTPFAEVARLVIRTLREVFGVASPTDLVYRRFARNGHDFAEPGLGIDAERPTTPRGKGQQVAPTVAELTPLVEAALRGFLGVDSIAVDASGNYPVRIGTNQLYLRILPPEPPAVRVFAVLLAVVAPSPELLTVINRINAGLVFGRVLVVDDQVIVATEVRSVGIRVDDIAWACAVVAGCAQAVVTEVASKLRQPSLLGAGSGAHLPN
jgi:hypothetical protein